MKSMSNSKCLPAYQEVYILAAFIHNLKFQNFWSSLRGRVWINNVNGPRLLHFVDLWWSPVESHWLCPTFPVSGFLVDHKGAEGHHPFNPCPGCADLTQPGGSSTAPGPLLGCHLDGGWQPSHSCHVPCP